jgi:type I restriction enzyme, S subunit
MIATALPTKRQTLRLRDLITLQSSSERKRILQSTDDVSFLPMEAIGEKGELDLSNIRKKKDVDTGYTLFFENDVLIAKITPCFENGKGAVATGLRNGFGFGTTELHVLNPRSNVDSRFLYYVTSSHAFRKLGEANMTGAAGQKRVPTEYVYNFQIDLPSLFDQRRISAYLDRKTQTIDALIASQKRLLELLGEKRRSLITHAVTRGLNANVSMQDSGIEWLGKIPSHWKVAKLRWFIKSLEQGWSPQADEREPNQDEWGVLKLNAVKDGEFYITKAKALPKDLEVPKGLEVQVGDFLITRANTPELVGEVCYVDQTRRYLMLSDLIYRLRLKEEYLNGQFLSYFLQSPIGRLQIKVDARGSSASMVKISQGHILDWILPLPSVSEQQEIVDYIDKKNTTINALSTITKQAIALLQERRTSLISAAVTGQLQIAD